MMFWKMVMFGKIGVGVRMVVVVMTVQNGTCRTYLIPFGSAAGKSADWRITRKGWPETGIDHLFVTTTTRSKNLHRGLPLVTLLRPHLGLLRSLIPSRFRGRTAGNLSIMWMQLLVHRRGCLPILRTMALPVVKFVLGGSPARLERLVDRLPHIGIIWQYLHCVIVIRIVAGEILLVITATLLVVDAGVVILPGGVLLDIGTIQLLGAILQGVTGVARAGTTCWTADCAVYAIVAVQGASLPTRPFELHLLILRKQEPGTGAGLQVRVCMSVKQFHLVPPPQA